MAKRYFTEMGMGTDVHGEDHTRAAERAVFDAIHHSSLNLFPHVGRGRDNMVLHVLIGVPEPRSVDASRVAAALPYGAVTIDVEVGGLLIPGEDGVDAIVIANADILVQFE